ncbi:MAG TPA: hypothetical protein VHH10_13175 [Rubrobacteraceae bacterium]|nr:hypothetical protein [Rubrobacteraceae bacterium]
MRALLLWILPPLFLAVLAVSSSHPPVVASPPPRPAVLVLVDGLSWDTTEREPGLEEAFSDGAAATLSVVQGTAPPDDPRFGYVFLGAGSRVDTRFLPEDLPADPARIPNAFDGPAQTVHPGSLGDALEEAGVPAAAVGDRARLVIMTSDGGVRSAYGAEDPIAGLESALQAGAGFVAVDAGDPRRAAELVEAAREAGAAVAVASPNGPPGTPNLTPFVLVQPEGEGGLLYSPTTRTEGLLTNADVAPTLLDVLGVPVPPEMSGRAAEARPGEAESAELLQRRLWFVEDEGFRVWGVVGVLWALGLAAGALRHGRRGVSRAVLAVAALPAGALIAAAIPVTNVLLVGALTALLAGGITALCWRISGSFAGALARVALATAGLVILDAAAGGPLERFSTLGYNPATGTRFYGVGNEYAAVLAGALTMGLGILAYRRRSPTILLAVVGAVAVLALGLPTMGADVGGSAVLGLAFGAALGLARGDGWRGVLLWAAGGLALAAVLFLASGLLFPGVSHGSRVAGGESGLYEVAARKLAISFGSLLNPVLLFLLALGAGVTYAGWRRARGTPLAAGIPAAVLAAVASGLLNDSGLIAALFALMYPALGALGGLISKENAGRPAARSG